MATNHFGPFLLTGLLLAAAGGDGDGRVVTVSSQMHRVARKRAARRPAHASGRYPRWHVYGQTKLANLLFTFELDRRLRQAGAPVTALAAHPGFAGTHLAVNGQLRPHRAAASRRSSTARSSAVSQSAGGRRLADADGGDRRPARGRRTAGRPGRSRRPARPTDRRLLAAGTGRRGRPPVVGDQRAGDRDQVPLRGGAMAADGTVEGAVLHTPWRRDFATPLRAFLHTESGSAGVLVAAIAVALVWANLDDTYERLWTTPFGSGSATTRHPRPADLGQQRPDDVLLPRRRPGGATRDRPRRPARPAAASCCPLAAGLSRHGRRRSASTSRSTPGGTGATAGASRCRPTPPWRWACWRWSAATCRTASAVFLLTVFVVDDIVALLVIAVSTATTSSVGAAARWPCAFRAAAR